MPPRKRVSSSLSSSRKANHNPQKPQPSKYGIQHFFERHSQSQPASGPSCPSNSLQLNCNRDLTSNHDPNVGCNPAPGSPSPADPPKSAPIANADDLSSQVSPVITKNAPLKRFKFSPGLIKQTQDDGGGDITWKVSPVNERFRSFTSIQLPMMMRVLSDPSMAPVSFLQPCLQKQDSTSSAGSLEKWISSPTLVATGKSLYSPGRVSIEQGPEMPHGNENSSAESLDNWFQTPPSALCRPSELAANIDNNGVSDDLGLGRHCKDLLELLNQVEDVIVEEAVPDNRMSCNNSGNDCEQNAKTCNSNEQRAACTATESDYSSISYQHFLVLEVSDKHWSDFSSIAKNQPLKVLRLLNESTGEERTLLLSDEWFYSVIGPGDTVSVIGDFDENGKCVVNHNNNLVIVFPDILVSGTRVASSFTCPRRAVLDERLKSREHSTSALIGTMLHQIFQAGLLKDFPTTKYLEECATTILQRNTENLYACSANESDTFAQLLEAIPRILNWIKCFRNIEGGRTCVVDFGHNVQHEVSVTEVMDIEEMAWAPKYGLKGIIDASLRIKSVSDSGNSLDTIVPLEIKTGKGTGGQTAMEHCAQVILYTILLSERYLNNGVDSGLLYYLHADETKGIKVQRSDLIGLIMRRNELASDVVKATTTQLLPPMLQNLSVCKGCRHLNACTIYHKAFEGSSESSGLGALFDSAAGHLTSAHIKFLKHWDHLIDLEAKTCQERYLRENHSSCLSSLLLDVTNGFSVDGSQNGRYIYHFLHQKAPQVNQEIGCIDFKQPSKPQDGNLDNSLRCGDYVIISTESGRPAIANGIICGINPFRVSISLSRPLRLPGGTRFSETADLTSELWRICKDEFSSSYAVMRFNLMELFVPRLQSSRLRKLIVDLEAPRFDSGGLYSQDPAVSYVQSAENINDDQRRVIQKILFAKDYTLILGMPGAGKTSTMVHAVKALLIRGASILLTSYTNSAVDNMLIKLKAQDIDFIRIGRQEAVHDEICNHCFPATEKYSVDDVRQRMEQVRVFGVTCLGINHPLLANKQFDVCIMDEAGQITLPVSLGPLMLASTFVLVGDPYQLPPLVQSTEAHENGMSVSLFSRLSEAHPQAISALQCQYRMCAGIMELSNALIYGNRLCCGSPEIANAKIKLSVVEPFTWWLKEVLDPAKSVVFINTDKLPAYEVREQSKVNNPVEAYIVSQIVGEMLRREIQEKDLGILTPYNLQAILIRRVVSASVEIHTIDKYQGRDKDCLMISFVRSTENSKACTSSLLGDWHRINVAITRAKKKLIMVGSCGTLSKVPILKLLIEKVHEQGGLLQVSTKDLGLLKELNKCSNTCSRRN